MDWSATFLDLANAEQDPDYPFDGQTLVPHLLRGKRLAERDLFWRLTGSERCDEGTSSTFSRPTASITCMTSLSTHTNKPTSPGGSRTSSQP